jgi:hypothetical protein
MIDKTNQGGFNPRLQMARHTGHPGSKPDKAAKKRQARAKAKRHCKRCPEMRGQKQKSRR